MARHGAAQHGVAEGGEGSHATPSDADDPRGRETIRWKEDTAHTVDKLCRDPLFTIQTEAMTRRVVSVVCIQYYNRGETQLVSRYDS